MSYMPLDLGNDLDRLPPLSVGAPLGYYDFTDPSSLSLVSSSDYQASVSTAPSIGQTGSPNSLRIAGVFNRMGSGVAGNAPDLLYPPRYSTIIGPMWRQRHTGSRGGAQFGPNERGISTAPPSFSMATPGAMATGDAFTISSTGTLPTLQFGIMAAGTTYYLIKQANGTFLVATSAANAAAGNWSPLVAQGSGTLTITDTTQSLTSTATINWFGLPMSSGQLYSVFDVVTVDRYRLRPLGSLRSGDNTLQTWQSISSLGNQWLGLGGRGGAAGAIGRLALAINGTYNGQLALESATLGLPAGPTSYDAQLLAIARVMQTSGGSASGSPASTKVYVNNVLSTQQGDKYVAPTAPLSQICIGDGASFMRSEWRPGHTHHFTLIFFGQLTVADIAALTAHFDAKMFRSLSRATSRALTWWATIGQSLADDYNGNTNNSAYTGTYTAQSGLVVPSPGLIGQNSPLLVEEEVVAGLTGAPVYVNHGRNQNGGALSIATPGRVLLGSEQPWTNSTTPNYTSTGFIDDYSAAVTPGTPSTYQLDAHSGSAGANLVAYIAACQAAGVPMPAGIVWNQGQNSAGDWAVTSNNANIAGNFYASAVTVENYAGRWCQAMTLLPGLITAAWGGSASSPLPMAIDHLSTISQGSQPQHQAIMAAAQILVDQNPTRIFLAGGNSWQHSGSSPSLHYVMEKFENGKAEHARTIKWWEKAKGTLYIEGASGPAYGQFPRLSSISAVTGNAYIDVTITNPNAATTLLLSSSAPTLGWRAYTGTTTTAIYTAGALAGATTSGAAGTYEKGGTALTITGVTLIAPFKVRLALSAALVAGTKVTVFYADAYAMDGVGGTAYPKSPEAFKNMLTDSSGTDFAAAEPLLSPFYKGRHMPVAIEACGLVAQL